MKTVAPGAELSRITLPPCSCITFCAMARPSPVPCSFPKLTNGVNSLSRMDSGTPGPLSLKQTSRPRGVSRSETSIRPESRETASQAFTRRLSNTRCSFFGSNQHSLLPSRLIEISTPSYSGRARIIRTAPSITSSTFPCTRCNDSRVRENSSSDSIRSVMRSTASRTSLYSSSL